MAARSLQSLTVTTDDADPDTATSWMKVNQAREDKALRVFFSGNGAAGSAVINANLRSPDGTTIWSDTATATITARRTGADGASGEYVCSVVFAQSGNEYLDLNGYIPPTASKAGLTDGTEWWIGVLTLSTITGGTLTVAPCVDI